MVSLGGVLLRNDSPVFFFSCQKRQCQRPTRNGQPLVLLASVQLRNRVRANSDSLAL